MQKLRDRKQAGEQLAEYLINYKNRNDVIVFALPRGGVPVAFEIAKKLHMPLDVFLVRKLGVPYQKELAMGAIASGEVIVCNQDIINDLQISPKKLEQVIAIEKQELERRNKLYRNDNPFPNLTKKIIILVDDGVATGATMNAAITAIKKLKPAEIIVASPVVAPDSYQQLLQKVNRVVCIYSFEPFYGVGMWYKEFPQITDEEVIQLLRQASDFVPSDKKTYHDENR